MVSADNGGRASAAAFACDWAGVLAPGITTVTASAIRIQRSAKAAIVAPCGTSRRRSSTACSATSNGTPEKVSPLSNASPLRLKLRWSSAAKVLAALILPVSRPEARGTRAITATPAARASAKNASAGRWRNRL